jgi:thiol:disulfide interchange protein DsbC
MTRHRWLAALLAAVIAGAAPADETTDRIIQRMGKMFPGEQVTDIVPAPLPGIYEVLLGASLFYVSADARYVFHGDLIDLEQRVNLSNRRRETARREVFAAIDGKDFIEFAPTTAAVKSTLYVFTDIDCGYCRKMHREVPLLNAAGISVRYLAFPRGGLDGPSFTKAVAVWCAADRQQAMNVAKAGQDVPYHECPNPVARQFELGRSIGITGTPAVYAASGRQLGGYVPAAEIIQMSKDGKI